MAAQSLLANESAYRIVRGVLDGALVLLWLVSLAAFVLRPSLHRYSLYARFASAAGAAILGFALAYGAAASWFGTGYVFFASFAVTGVVIARVSRVGRWVAELGAALFLGVLGVYARGVEAAFPRWSTSWFPVPVGGGRTGRGEDTAGRRDFPAGPKEPKRGTGRAGLPGSPHRLYNRRYGFEGLRKSISFVRRYGGELHILVLDIDHFKRVNDELGHPVGDTILTGLAQILMGTLRDSDIAARIGGEEFLVVLPRGRPEHAQSVANRIRDTMARTSFESVPWRVTVSVGVTSLREDDTAESMFSRRTAFYTIPSGTGGTGSPAPSRDRQSARASRAA
jgi:diguanylate cyclase (GGDEF)-like protein